MNVGTLMRLPASWRNRFRDLLWAAQWFGRDFSGIAPPPLRRSVLRRYGGENRVWLESGTYLGDTAAYLATFAHHVYTAEPDVNLASYAHKRFGDDTSVTVLQMTGAKAIEVVAERYTGAISFWLDGHYSGPDTFQGGGGSALVDELEGIARFLDRFTDVTVLIDDDGSISRDLLACDAGPSATELVQWSSRHGFKWTIEHGIFVMWRHQAGLS